MSVSCPLHLFNPARSWFGKVFSGPSEISCNVTSVRFVALPMMKATCSPLLIAHVFAIRVRSRSGSGPVFYEDRTPLAICESTSVHCNLVDWASQRGKTRINDQCNLTPHAGVVLDLMMGLVERAGEPRIVSTIDAVTFVSHMKIADDLGPSRIFGDDLFSSVERPLRLEEIDCLFNIGRYEDRILTRFGYDIDLNGEHYGNPKLLQAPGKGRSLRCSPAMPKQDDLCLAPFR